MKTANSENEKTRLEWAKEGKCPKKGCTGSEKWNSRSRTQRKPEVFYTADEVHRNKRGAAAYQRKMERLEAAEKEKLRKEREEADRKPMRCKLVLRKAEFASKGLCWILWNGDYARTRYGYGRKWHYLPKSITTIHKRNSKFVEFSIPNWLLRREHLEGLSRRSRDNGRAHLSGALDNEIMK